MGPKVDSDENVFVKSMLQNMFSYFECRHVRRRSTPAACTNSEDVAKTPQTQFLPSYFVGKAVDEVETEGD